MADMTRRNGGNPLKKYALLIAATAAFSAAPLAAMAAPADDSGAVFGISGVRDDSNVDDLTGGGSADAAWGWDVYFGYAFNRYFTLRGGKRYFGEAESEVGSGKLSIDSDGFYVAGDLMWPVTDRFSIGATLGIQQVDVELEAKQRFFGGRSFSHSESDDARDYFYGVRARWGLGESSSLVAFYNQYSFEVDDSSDDLEYDSLGLGLEWRF